MDLNVPPSGTPICVPVIHTVGTSPRYAAFEQTLPDLAALDPKSLITINVDVAAAATNVLARLPGLRALRSAIVSELPAYDLARFDTLERLALALQHTHAMYVSATTTPAELIALNAEGLKLREQLRADGNALALHGLLDATSLAEVKGQPGYRNIGVELMVLTSLFRKHAATISGKTVVDSAQLDHADEVADQLLLAAAVHEQAPAKLADIVQTRQRAFTLFANVYDHVRRAVTYLRWNEGDADAIAPSIYAGRKHAKSDTKEVTTPSTETPTVPVAPAPAALEAGAPIGMPGSSPFIA